MQQIRITRTANLNGVLSFLKERYPLLSEAEIIKMALSRQYYQEVTHKDTKELDEIPNEYLRKSLEQSEEDIKAGRVLSFASAKDALEYLDKEIADEKQARH
jgi:hypothetical protein